MMKMKKIRKAVRVYSKNFVDDFFMNVKNLVGGRLTAYEEMINKGIEECMEELSEYNLKNLKIDTDELAKEAVMILVYGEEA